MILTASTAMVIHMLSHCIDQPPGSMASAGEFRAQGRALIELVQALHRTSEDDVFVIQRLGQQVTKEAQSLFRSDRTLR